MAETPLQPAIPKGRLLLQRALTVLAAVLMGLPLVQQLADWPADPPLVGAELRLPRPVFGWPAWFDGLYAARYEKWLQTHAGFRGLLVRLACQANYSLFNRIGLAGGTEITQGKDHWLYETAYVKSAARQPDFSRKKAEQFAGRAAALERLLAGRGIAFGLIIAPSKAEVLPEHLPDGLVLPPRSPATAYARIRAELAKQGVPFVDSRALFQELKASEPFLFPKTGTHWSACAAWLVWQEAAAGLEARRPDLRFRFPAEPRIVMNEPLGADKDLRDLLNLWHFEPGGPARLPYPIPPPPPPEWRDRHQAVVVGDSFSLTICDAMARSGLFRQIDLLYYFKRRYTYPAPSFSPAPHRLMADPGIDMGPIDPARPDWKSLLDNRQLVLLVINEIHLKDTGWGALESLLAELEKPASYSR
jgi:hypothetical protein